MKALTLTAYVLSLTILVISMMATMLDAVVYECRENPGLMAVLGASSILYFVTKKNAE